MSHISAVLFDLDNTLYDNDEALEAWARERAQELLTPAQSAGLTRALSQLLEQIEQARGIESHTVNRENTGSLLRRLIPGLTTPAIEFVSTMHTNWLANMQLTADAAEILNALDAIQMPYGVVTNAPPSQRIKTNALGLEARANCILISGEFGADKPDPTIFLAAAMSIGVPPDQILFVGDSPEHDIVGAHSAGMKTAWLRRGRDWPEELRGREPDYEIERLMEVEGIVGSS